MPERKRLQEGPLVVTFPVEIYQNFRSEHVRKYLTSTIHTETSFHTSTHFLRPGW
jgi:hypothetical protein